MYFINYTLQAKFVVDERHFFFFPGVWSLQSLLGRILRFFVGVDLSRELLSLSCCLLVVEALLLALVSLAIAMIKELAGGCIAELHEWLGPVVLDIAYFLACRTCHLMLLFLVCDFVNLHLRLVLG